IQDGVSTGGSRGPVAAALRSCGGFLFYCLQKTPYEVATCLEFRGVVFRSQYILIAISAGADRDQDVLPAVDAVSHRRAALRGGRSEERRVGKERRYGMA